MPREYDFFVYFLTNRRNEVPYIGVTNDLLRRLEEHGEGTGSHFTRQYNVTKLVFYEHFGDVEEAIAREKQLKGWMRASRETRSRGTPLANWEVPRLRSRTRCAQDDKGFL